MSTALDIITGAAKLIGVVFKSETLDDDEANDGLVALNDMLDSWSNDSLLVSAYTEETFSLTGASSYTIGTGGTFNTSRPITIKTAVVRSGNIDYDLKIITPEQYQSIALKSTASPIPEYLVYDNVYPLGTIKLYPVASAGSTLTMLSNKPLSNLSALTTAVTLAPGWKRALKYNLAIELAPEYGVDVPAWVIRNAGTSKGDLKRAANANKAMPYMPDEVTTSNIFTGYFTR